MGYHELEGRSFKKTEVNRKNDALLWAIEETSERHVKSTAVEQLDVLN
jgi:hypothetical protein